MFSREKPKILNTLINIFLLGCNWTSVNWVIWPTGLFWVFLVFFLSELQFEWFLLTYLSIHRSFLLLCPNVSNEFISILYFSDLELCLVFRFSIFFKFPIVIIHLVLLFQFDTFMIDAIKFLSPNSNIWVTCGFTSIVGFISSRAASFYCIMAMQ